MIGIYLIRDTTNGKCYVGQSRDIEYRFKRHKSGQDKHMLISRAIAKRGVGAFDFSVIEACSLDELNDLEKHWIAHYECIAPKGYNATSGGERNYSVSELTRRKMCIAQKGKVVSLTTREKLSAANIGKSQSEETIAKKSDSLRKSWGDAAVHSRRVAGMIGRKIGIDTRKKISASNSGKRRTAETKKALSVAHGCNGVLRSDGVVFDSVSAAAMAVGGATTNISKAISGKRKTAYGYTYSFLP